MQFSTILQLYKVIGVLFNGLLAELPTIPAPQVTDKKTRQVLTSPYGPMGAVNSPKSSQISGKHTG